MKLSVGFAGLGQMGYPMAENILKKGFSLHVYNRTKQKAELLLGHGAKWAATPRELVRHCDVVISMVSNDDALKGLVHGNEGLLSEGKRGLVHISMSTVSPSLVETLQQEHKRAGGELVAAPVSGLPQRAQAGTLWVFTGGDRKAKEKVQPVLEAMSSKVFDFGDQAKSASLFKLCNNFMILSVVESLSEALTLLEKNGVSPEKALEAWLGSQFDAIIYKTYGEVLSKKLFHPARFALDLGLKDMRMLEVCSEQGDMPMPLLSLILEKLNVCMSMGREKHDWSVIALLTRELAGLKD